MLIRRAEIAAVPMPVAFGQTHRALVHGRRSGLSNRLGRLQKIEQHTKQTQSVAAA